METMVNIDFWNKKKVLVTGHTGFKGSWLCMMLKKFGADISGYALDPPTDPSLYNLCDINSFVKSTIGDIRDFNSLLNKIEQEKPEIIFHMAAQPLVKLSYEMPVLTYQTNIIGTINLLEAVRVSKSKSVRVLVNITSDKCYENKEWLWPYRENEPLGGYDPYSSSKACSEIVTASYRNSFFNLAEYSKHHVAIATARAGNVIGGGDWATDRLIPDIVRSILENKPIIIRNPDAIRPWQHVLEPLHGYLLLAHRLFIDVQTAIGAWNFGPSEDDAKSVKWIVEYFCQKWPHQALYLTDKNPQLHEANYLKLDSSKARNILGWKPVWNLEQTIDNIIEFCLVYKKNQSTTDICNSQIEQFLSRII
jgi:CDP-glucose 4,6-dehydratase